MPIRVIIADDHEGIRSGLRMLIEDDPELSVVGEAANGQQAVEFAETLQPDVVLMDVNMPVLDGVEATKAITARWPQIRVIGLSVYGVDEVEQTMRDAGAVCYLPKFVNIDDLLDAIRAATP